MTHCKVLLYLFIYVILYVFYILFKKCLKCYEYLVMRIKQSHKKIVQDAISLQNLLNNAYVMLMSHSFSSYLPTTFWFFKILLKMIQLFST